VNKLKILREKRHLTQSQLAQKSGVSQGYISELENGKKQNPSAKKLKKLSKVLGIALADLLDDDSLSA